MPKLTQRVADALSPPADTSQAFAWCSELRGFGIRCTKAGAKSYVAQRRVGTRERRITLGPHSLLRCEEARDRARRELLSMRDGIDPVVERQRVAAQSTTLREVMEDYIKHRRTKHGALRAQTIADIRKHCTKSFESWVDRPIREVTQAKVLTRFKELSATGKSQANQAMIVFQSLHSWARKENPELPPNPVAVLKGMWNPSKPRTGRIPNDKVGAAWNLLMERLATEDDHKGTHAGAAIVAFLILTGARWGEAAKLTWDRLDLDAKVPSWHLTSEQAKNHNAITLPLSSQAVAVLRGRPHVKGNPYVFAGRADKRPISDPRALWEALAKVSGVDSLSAHDMRRTFTNIALKLGVDLYKAELLTNHVPSHSVTLTHYVETNDLRESCAAEVQRIGDWVAEQAAKAAGANVVQLNDRKAA